MLTAVSIKTMKDSDYSTAEKTVGGTRELMRRVGEELAYCVKSKGFRSAAVICGVGGNGGDGFAAAMYLSKLGIPPTLFVIEDRFSEDGKYFSDECEKLRIERKNASEIDSFEEFDVILDCIYGVGFHGKVKENVADIINKINSSGKYVISADINSGLSGNSGLGENIVNSDLTLAVGALKYGHILGMAKDVIKETVVIPVGIEINGHHANLLDDADLAPLFTPRKKHSHKGSYGTAAILGGCKSYSGAVKLSALAMSALRSGAGISRIIIPGSITDGVLPYILEPTLFTLPDLDGHIIYDPEKLDEALSRVTSLSIGMGWGKSDENIKILRHILKNYQIPVTIDADGLNSIAENDVSVLDNAKSTVILTPHPAEFSRLSGISTPEILSDPVEYAEDFAKKHNVILLLKGTATVVTDGEKTYLISRGSPGMAKGGSGDVLSGVLAGLLAYLPASPLTVAAGAYLCGVAGELAAEEVGDISAVASDTVRFIPEAVKEIRKKF